MPETIPALFARQAATYGARALFLVKRQGRYQPISWQQADADVHALAVWLLSQQVNAGDRVLVLSENRPEWGMTDLATQSVGGWVVPAYPSLTSHDVVAIARDCQPVIGVASNADQLEKLVKVQREVSSLRTLLVMGDGQVREGVVQWTGALTEGRAASARYQGLLQERGRGLHPEATCTLIYTSGTTGEPKGVMLSHRNFLSNVEACRQIIPLSASDLHLSFLPLCHVFERMAGWYLMLHVGASVAYAENMDTIPQNMLEVRPTVMLGVPRFFEKLYDRIQEALRAAPPQKRRIAEWALGVGRVYAACVQQGTAIPVSLRLKCAVAHRLVFRKFQARLGGQLRFFVSGSAPLSKDIGQFFFSIGVTILEGYGLTETSPVIAANRLPTPVFGSVGPPVPGVEVRLAADGEILTRGPHVMQGYYGKPDATKEVLVDGWFHTGDIGSLDEAGNLHITDRKKDLIKTAGGKFVAPQKLEGRFVADPYIAQAFVYGDRERYCVALIVPKIEAMRRYAQERGIEVGSPEVLARDPRIQQFYWERVQERQQDLASFEQVKRIAVLGEEFSQSAGELTPTLKAKRQIIAARYAAILRGLYEAPGS